MENNYMRWCGMIEADDFGDKSHSAPPPLYTNAGKSNLKKGAAKPFQGWSAEGYQRFDVLYKEENSKKRHNTVTEEDDGEEVVYASHDFDDVVQGGTKITAKEEHDFNVANNVQGNEQGLEDNDQSSSDENESIQENEEANNDEDAQSDDSDNF
jgi:phosphopantothenoylcysteine synthetase/decarboxylase